MEDFLGVMENAGFDKDIEDFIFQPKYILKSLQYLQNDLYNNKPISKMSKSQSVSYNENIILNSNFYRSDEFIYDHDGTHLLFSGCSVTYGTGLLLDEIWAKRLYNKINEKEKCSGFFNLSVPGSSIANQIIDIFKYCKTYGNPNYIFLNMPDKFRFYAMSKTNHQIVDSMYGEESLELITLIGYHYYFMLEQYCKTNNIKFYSFSWSYPEIFFSDYSKLKNQRYTDNKFKLFDSFVDIDIKDLSEHIYNYKQANQKDIYAELARDDDHFGTAYHDYWYNLMYKKYLEEK